MGGLGSKTSPSSLDIMSMEGPSIPVMGAANTELRDGIHACRLDRSVAHPVAGSQQGAFTKQFEAKAQEVSALYGAHMGMRMKMEAAILSRHQRLPGGLKSNFVGLSSVNNMDEEFGFEDVLDMPDLREAQPMQVHEAMEMKLKM